MGLLNSYLSRNSGDSSNGSGGGILGTLMKRNSRSKFGSGGGGVDPGLVGKSDSVDYTSDYSIPMYHKGGIVRKTGLARLKKGERVLTKSQAKKLRNKM